jgi:thiamine monophosphate synthase
MKYEPDMICMISGIFSQKDIKKEIKDIKSKILK